jgi:hypothetical protein
MKASGTVSLVLLLALAGSVEAQAPGPTVALTGLDGQQATISMAELDALPRVTLEITHQAAKHTYEGALLADVLTKIQAPRGKAIHGADLADVVVVQAKDGYKVALDLAGTDAVTRQDRVILADRMDGAALGDKQGPFQLVVEGDLRPARAARMVTAIAVKRVQ